MKIFPSILCLAFTLLFISCQKKSDPAPAGPSKTDQLTASSWKLEDAGFDQDKNGSIELSAIASLPACVVDNTISFKKDNTGITDEGTTKCNAADAQSTPFNWNFADAEESMTVSNSVLTQINGKSKIVLLTETNLTLAKDTTVLGMSGWVVVKLKH